MGADRELASVLKKVHRACARHAHFGRLATTGKPSVRRRLKAAPTHRSIELKIIRLHDNDETGGTN
jgi:hypothetical protein